MREHIRAHHSGPDPKQGAGGGGYVCKVCGMALITSEDLCLHLVKHSDENTARHRKPALAPRKYKRRRRLKPHEMEYGNEDSPDTESDSSVGGRKAAKPRPDYESVVRSFDAAIDTINSMVGRSKVKKKRKMKRTGPQGDESEPNMSMADPPLSLNAPNRLEDNEMRSPGAIRIRPRIKNVSAAQRTPVRPPKAIKSTQSPMSPPLSLPPPMEDHPLSPPTPLPPPASDDQMKVRKGPRTKNVNYHHEKRPAKPAPAKFPKEPKVPKPRGRKPIRKPKFLTQNGMRDKKAAAAAAPVLIESVKVEPIAQVKEEVREEFKCEICGEIFYTRPELLFHVSIHI